MASFDVEKAKRWKKELDRIEKESVEAKASYMGDCSARAERKKKIFKAAKSDGMSVPAFKKYLKALELEAKAKACYEELESDDETLTFEELAEHLGGLATLPLGEAALAKTPKKSAKGMPGADAPASIQ